MIRVPYADFTISKYLMVLNFGSSVRSELLVTVDRGVVLHCGAPADSPTEIPEQNPNICPARIVPIHHYIKYLCQRFDQPALSAMPCGLPVREKII